MIAAGRNGKPSRIPAPLRCILAVWALGGAVGLAAWALLSPAEPFDATLRFTVWLAVVIAAVTGATKPAALFGTVAALVEICADLTATTHGPGSPASIPAVLVALSLIATSHGPTARRALKSPFRPTTPKPHPATPKPHAATPSPTTAPRPAALAPPPEMLTAPLPTGEPPTGQPPTEPLPTGPHPTGQTPTEPLPTGLLRTGQPSIGPLSTSSHPAGTPPTGSHPAGTPPTGSLQTGAPAPGPLAAHPFLPGWQPASTSPSAPTAATPRPQTVQIG